MTEFSKSELERKLAEAKKEIEYYKKIAQQTGNLYLRETEELSKLIRWRQQAEEELQESKEILKATVESTADGILVVNEKGRVICKNERFMQMFRIPEELIKKREDKQLLDFVLDQLKEPEAFLSKVNTLYKTSDEDFDVLDFKDGRIFERFSSPLIGDGQIAGRVWSFRDITDRKRMEQTLRESEEKFRFLAEKMVDIVWIIDRNFRTTYVSPSIKNVLGFTPEERKRQPLEEMITPESLQKVQIMFLEEIQKDQQGTADPDRSITVEVEYFRADGSTVWMENVVKAIRGPNGEIFGMHGVARDISRRKKTEDTLRESESRYKSLFKNNHSVMLLVDPESADIVDANPAAISYYGWRLEELTAMKITDINILTEVQIFQEMEKAKSEERCQFIFQHRLSNGDFRDVEVYSGPIKLHGRKLLYSIIHDITDRIQAEKELQKAYDELERRVEERASDLIKMNEQLKREIITRKQAEAALQESGEKFRQLFDTVSDAIMLLDVATKEFIDVNGICQIMYGYGKDEFLNLSLSSITAEPEESEQSIKQILSGEISRIPLRYHKRKDGTIFPVEISSGTFKLGDRRILCGVVRDITERMQTEEALRKKREELSQKAKHLEKVNTALEVLLQHLEEEKKKLEENILVNLKKFIFPYIEKLEAGDIDPKNKTYLDIIKTNFNKVIFPFAKNQIPGYLNLTPTEIHVADLIREGNTHKDIALLSNVSTHSVLFHMKNIRKKLGLSHKKINLRTYLQSLAR